MKKLLVSLLGALLILSVQAEEVSYEIDPMATANAPWEVGETVHTRSRGSVGIVFLGVTKDGYFLVQEFFDNDDEMLKRTDPYIVMNEAGVTEKEPSLFHGKWIVYDVEGSLVNDCSFQRGTTEDPPCVAKTGDLESHVTTTYENNISSVRQMIYQNGIPNIYIEGSYDYQTGVKNMKIDLYYPSGVKMSEWYMRNNDRVGIARSWDEEGNLTSEIDHGYPEDKPEN